MSQMLWNHDLPTQFDSGVTGTIIKVLTITGLEIVTTARPQILLGVVIMPLFCVPFRITATLPVSLMISLTIGVLVPVRLLVVHQPSAVVGIGHNTCLYRGYRKNVVN